MICEVLPLSAGIDNALDYYCPIELISHAQRGKRAVIQLKNRIVTGIILSIKQTTNYDGALKHILDIIDDEPIVEDTHIEFARWISEYYMCSLSESLKNFISPAGEVKSQKIVIPDNELCKELYEKQKDKNSPKSKILLELSQKEKISLKYLAQQTKIKNIYGVLKSLSQEGALIIEDNLSEAYVKPKIKKIVKLATSIEEAVSLVGQLEKKYPKQALALVYLLNKKNSEIEYEEIAKKKEISSSSIKSLVSKGILKIIKKEESRADEIIYRENAKDIILSDEQKNAVEKISSHINEKNFKVFLIKGVTGSGKTQVYIECARLAALKGLGVIIMVPEISLTPQIYARMKNEFGDNCVVVHSKMSSSKRYDAWKGILAGKYKIIIGPRSALFYPIKNVGLIVVDEEHESSYKQWEAAPRYQARDCAVILGKLWNCPVVLGSATPSIESMHNAAVKKYELIELTKRIKEAVLPDIKLVNLISQKKLNKLQGALSQILLDEISSRLQRKESVILFKNRRGFSTILICENCGFNAKCRNCSANLTYHIKIDKLLCHHCGYSTKTYDLCPNCGSSELKYYGVGTQKIEDELAYYFPQARIERIDSDAAARKGKIESILQKFANGDIDILVGTQMVAKGLDFERVTLVGVILADSTIWLPDFRASERTFQLLTQVAGRSGRGEKKGEVIIQTYNPNHPAIKLVASGNIDDFYDYEIILRKKFLYPPFSRLALIEFKSASEEKAQKASEDFYKFLTEENAEQILIIPKPFQAALYKLKKEYRMQILIKAPKEKDPSGAIMRKIISKAQANFLKKSLFSSAKYYIDIDPYFA